MSLFRRKKPQEAERRPANQPATYSHYSGSGVCDVCSRPVGSGEAFQVPTAVFWGSRKYREWVDTNPVTRGMLMMSGATVDEYIAMQRRMDKTAYSAVCPECIHLFQ